MIHPKHPASAAAAAVASLSLPLSLESLFTNPCATIPHTVHIVGLSVAHENLPVHFPLLFDTDQKYVTFLPPFKFYLPLHLLTALQIVILGLVSSTAP